MMDYKIGDHVKWRPFGVPEYAMRRGVVTGLFIRSVHPDGSHEIGYDVLVGKRRYRPRPVLLQRDDWYRRIIYRLVPRSGVVGQISTGSSTKSTAVTPDE